MLLPRQGALHGASALATTLLPEHPVLGAPRSTIAHPKSSGFCADRSSWVCSGGAWREFVISRSGVQLSPPAPAIFSGNVPPKSLASSDCKQTVAMKGSRANSSPKGRGCNLWPLTPPVPFGILRPISGEAGKDGIEGGMALSPLARLLVPNLGFGQQTTIVQESVPLP